MTLDKYELDLLQSDILLYFEFKYGIPKTSELDNEIFYDFYYTDQRYLHAYGSRAAGKSRELMGKYPVVHMSCLPFCRFVGIRAVRNTIKGSMFQEIVDYIDEWELNKFFKITRSPMKITHIESKNYMQFAGFNRPDLIKSIKDPTHVIVEEAFQINDEEGMDTLDKTIRTPKLEYATHKIIHLYNTDNTNHMLYEQNFDPELAEKYKFKRRNSFYKKITYKDNKFLPQTIIDIIEADKTSNPERYEVDGLGNWGRLTIDGLFYSSFSYAEAVQAGLKKTIYNRLLPIHITFDFNVDPFISLIINQIHHNEETNELELCAIDEICITESNKMGKIDETLMEFLRRYKRHIGDVVVHGDRSGHSRQVQGKTDYSTVFAHLKQTPQNKMIKGKQNGRPVEIDPYPEYEQMDCKFRVVDNTDNSQNPPLKARQILQQRMHAGNLSVLKISRTNGTMNAAGGKRPLSQQFGGCKVITRIDQENCRMLIRDYQEVTEDIAKGGKCSRPYYLTHTSDAQDYFVCDILSAELNLIKMELKH